MYRAAAAVVILGLSACTVSSADRPSCMALSEAYVSIIRETVADGVPPEVTARTLERADAALEAATDDGDARQEAQCRAVIDIAVAARDLAPADFAVLWSAVEAEGLLPGD